MAKEISRSEIVELLEMTNEKFIESELRPFLKIPSNTLNQDGIKKAKNFIISYISDFCDEVMEYPGEVNPIIRAKITGNVKDTLLIYMMYDTQPINKEKEWMTPPFGAEIKILSPPLDVLGDCIIARGAYNSKTPLLSFLSVIKTLKENNSLPLSLLLVFDGSEEIGSPDLLKFLRDNKETVMGCRDAYYPSIKQDLSGNSILKLGYKGILSLTIIVSSKNKEPHSAFSAMIPNPANDLILLLNEIYSNNEFHIASLKKAYNLTEEENSIIEELLNVLNLEEIKNKAGIVETLESKPKKAFTDYLFKPTFNISTLKSGFLEEGTKNMVPNKAQCNIDIRFPHDVSVDQIFEEIQEKANNIKKKIKSDFQLIKNIGYGSSRVKRDSMLVQSLVESAKILKFKSVFWPISAAAAPLSEIKRILGLNFLVGGLGIGGFAHAPNEFVQIDSIINTRLSYYYFLDNYAKWLKKGGFE
jgi:acetylornithine deacetylase/succinyl-diaminopimelate desuccinylase-like protein